MRPITMLVNYTLTNTAVPVPHGDLEPVLDDYIPTTVTGQVCPPCGHWLELIQCVSFAGKLYHLRCNRQWAASSMPEF